MHYTYEKNVMETDFKQGTVNFKNREWKTFPTPWETFISINNIAAKYLAQ